MATPMASRAACFDARDVEQGRFVLVDGNRLAMAASQFNIFERSKTAPCSHFGTVGRVEPLLEASISAHLQPLFSMPSGYIHCARRDDSARVYGSAWCASRCGTTRLWRPPTGNIQGQLMSPAPMARLQGFLLFQLSRVES